MTETFLEEFREAAKLVITRGNPHHPPAPQPSPHPAPQPAPHPTPAPQVSWLDGLHDPTLKQDVQAMKGHATEANVDQMLVDLKSELSSAHANLSQSQLHDLQTISSHLQSNESASAYTAYTLNALVSGNSANADWTGGAMQASTLGNLASGSTATQLGELTSKWMLGGDLPSTGQANASLGYHLSHEALFGAQGPQASDVNQGQLGDCYLLSSLAEMAVQNPNALRSMITDNGNGTYGVEFHVQGKPVYVTVNNEVQDTGNTGNSLWATLVEKAYAQLQDQTDTTGNAWCGRDSMANIGAGGDPGTALQVLTGATQLTQYAAGGTSWGSLQVDAQDHITGFKAGISSAALLQQLADRLGQGDDLVLSSASDSVGADGRLQLVSSHAMSIVGVDVKHQEVEIRNPWGAEPGQYWDTDFKVSLDTLLKGGDVIYADNMGSMAHEQHAAAAPAPVPLVGVQSGTHDALHLHA